MVAPRVPTTQETDGKRYICLACGILHKHGRSVLFHENYHNSMGGLFEHKSIRITLAEFVAISGIRSEERIKHLATLRQLESLKTTDQAPELHEYELPKPEQPKPQGWATW